MARQLRNFEIGGVYHILNRGIERRNIFIKPQDFQRFIFDLEFCNSEQSLDLRFVKPGFVGIEKRIVDLLAFALMPNHFHLLLREIQQGGISLFMKKIGGYTTYFNKQYNREGSLFQSRFKSIKIKNDEQLAVVFAYIHTNPIELQEPFWKEYYVKNQEEALNWLRNYRWSSYLDYVDKDNFPTTIQRDFLLNYFGGRKECKQFIEDWVNFKARNSKLGSETLE